MFENDWYDKISLSSNIIVYYSWRIWDTTIPEFEYIRDELYWAETLYDIQNFVKTLVNIDSDLNLIAIDYYTNRELVYLNPIGTKPLYVNSKSQFSPSINKLVNEDSELDYQYLGQIRWFGYNQNDLTPWKNIKRLLPGYIYEWNINTFYFSNTHTQLCDMINTAFMLPTYLAESVNKRLKKVEDNTIWVLLSGWLDSSLITSILVKANEYADNPKNLRFFTTENAQDMDYAKEVADFLWIKLEVISWDDVELTKAEIFEVNETPIDLGSVVPNMKLFKRISSMWIKTIFTGDGPDEMFRWYRRNAEEDFDYHESDMKNELVFYHFPKLEKASRYYWIELVTPYITPKIWNMALSFDVKPYKQDLKDFAHWLIPESVIARPKEPLKNNSIREDKASYQHKFLVDFISYSKLPWGSTQTIKK